MADFKDKKVVVLAWFPRAFTGGCTAECKSIKENGDAIRKFDVAYFTASTDDVEASPVSKGNKAFAESLSADYPILSDPEGKTAKEYGVLNAAGTAAKPRYVLHRQGRQNPVHRQSEKRRRTRRRHSGQAERTGRG